MFQRGKHLLVNILLDKEFVDDDLDVVVFVFVKFDFLADVVRFAVNADVAAPLRADVVKEVVVILAVDFEDRGVDFYFRAFR